MGENTLREIGRYFSDYWYLRLVILIIVVLIAVAFLWVTKKLGA